MTISSLADVNSKDAVVHPSNSSVRFDLFRWSNNLCPVDYFVISYKKSEVSSIQKHKHDTISDKYRYLYIRFNWSNNKLLYM